MKKYDESLKQLDFESSERKRKKLEREYNEINTKMVQENGR